MGLLARSVTSLVPDEIKARRRVGTAVPTWQADAPQYPQNTRAYERIARQSYLGSEIIFAAVQAIARSASTPQWVAYKEAGKDAQKFDDHPALQVLNNPNHFWTRFQLMQSTVISLHIAGNAYWERVRNRQGQVVEYWPLRPDRIRVIPDPDKYILGYEYRLGAMEFRLDPEDVLHFKTHHPLDDYYGLPPLAPLAERADIDVWSREFTLAFFRNAGVPSGMLNIQRSVADQERELIKQRFRQQYGGPQGWGNVLVIDSGQATYTPMGMGPGTNGLALSELNQVSESRICAVLNIPPSIIWTVLGHTGSTGLNNATKEDDRTQWWRGSLAPMYEDLAQQYTLLSAGDFENVDHFGVDLSTAPGMGEDATELIDNWTKVWQAGGITWTEYRQKLGLSEEAEEKDQGMVYLAATVVPTPWKQMSGQEKPPPEPPPVPAHTHPLNALPSGSGQQAKVPVARPANGAVRGATGEGNSGHAETPNAGKLTLRVIETGGTTYDVLPGCPEEKANEHWRDRDLGVCVWCDEDPLEGKDLGEGLFSGGGALVPPEIAPRRRRRKKTGDGHDYGSTQVNLPDGIADELVQWVKEHIEPDDLAEGGYEDQPHITIKYGLLPDVNADDVRRIVAEEPPVTARFGLNAAFPVGESGAPLYVQVDSPDLHRMHGMVKAALPNEETYPTYTPHVTLAYLKPEAVEKYVGSSSPLAGTEMQFGSVMHCDQDEHQTDIPLDTRKAGGIATFEPGRRQRKTAEETQRELFERLWAEKMAAQAPELAAPVFNVNMPELPQPAATSSQVPQYREVTTILERDSEGMVKRAMKEYVAL